MQIYNYEQFYSKYITSNSEAMLQHTLKSFQVSMIYKHKEFTMKNFSMRNLQWRIYKKKKKKHFQRRICIIVKSTVRHKISQWGIYNEEFFNEHSTMKNLQQRIFQQRIYNGELTMKNSYFQ